MRRKAGTICVLAGAVLLLCALALMAYNKWDSWRAGQAVASVQERLAAMETDLQESLNRPTYDGTYTPATEEEEEEYVEMVLVIDGYEYLGTLSIPRFGLELPVMSQWSYPGLKIAPGRYVGGVATHDLVICGHNYERHFGNLKYLEPGDEIAFTDVLGNVFTYEVVEVEILQPTAIEEMITGDWDLTLFTCTLGGRTRVTVRCRAVE